MTFSDFLKNLPSILISGKKSATKRIERKSLALMGNRGAMLPHGCKQPPRWAAYERGVWTIAAQTLTLCPQTTPNAAMSTPVMPCEVFYG